MNLRPPLPKGLALFAGLSVFAAVAAASADSMSGKEVFLEHRCNICHTVDSLGIRAELKDKGQPDNAPDLSNAASLIPDEAWVESFLHKKERKDGKTHPMKFVGGDKQLSSLVDWLMSLRTGAGAAKSPGPPRAFFQR